MKKIIEMLQTKESSLKNKNILIFGASSGLGNALATSLATEGSKLHLVSRSIHQQHLNFPAHTYSCDITNPSDISETFTAVYNKTPIVDYVINCVGRCLVKKLKETTTSEILELIQTNLIGAMLISKEAYQHMLEVHAGQIITVLSTSALKPRAEETIYCASKWGLRGFTQSLALEAKNSGIKVIDVYTGGMNTAFWEGSNTDSSTFMDPKLVAQQIIALMKQPEDIWAREIVIERK